MFSTLSLQQSLTRIKPTNSSAFINSKQYLLVRNPYLRIASFFKDKFRQVVANHEGKKGWQHCQKIFFDNLGLEETMDYKIIKSKLLNTTFDEFIELLPNLYHLDDHLHPQYVNKEMLVNTWGKEVSTNFNLEKIFKMECTNDLNEMATRLNLDLTIKKNSTNKLNSRITWTTRNQKIIQQIYSSDFESFGYDFNPSKKTNCN